VALYVNLYVNELKRIPLSTKNVSRETDFTITASIEFSTILLTARFDPRKRGTCDWIQETAQGMISMFEQLFFLMFLESIERHSLDGSNAVT